MPIKRLVLVDIFRLVCVLFIVHFHAWMMIVGEESSYGFSYPLFHILESTHSLGFDRAGIWVATLSFFLFGYNGRLSLWRIPLFAAGIVSIQFVGTGMEDAFRLSSFSWGVFSLLLTAYLVLLVTTRLPRLLRWMVHAPCILLVFVPISLWQNVFGFLEPGLLRQALIGDVLGSQVVTGWFLLPWIGVLIAAFEVGSEFKRRTEYYSEFRWYDAIPFLIAIPLGVVTYLGGPEFEAGMSFNRPLFWVTPSVVVWTMLAPLLICRLSVLKRVQQFLLGQRMATAVSNFRWNKDFWLCYLFHFVFLLVVSKFFSPDTLREPWVFQILPLVSIIAIELYVRLAIPPDRKGWIFRSSRRKLVQN